MGLNEPIAGMQGICGMLEKGAEFSESIYAQNTLTLDATHNRLNANLMNNKQTTEAAVLKDAFPTSLTSRLGKSVPLENSKNTMTAEIIHPNAIKSPHSAIKSLKLRDFKTFSYAFIYP